MPVSRCQILNTRNSFLLRLMSEHWAGDGVADRVNAVSTRGEMVIHRDSAFLVQFNSHALQSEMIGVWYASHRHQHPITSDRLSPFAFDNASATRHLSSSHFATQPEFQSLLFEELFG